jgi:hypothetical protein
MPDTLAELSEQLHILVTNYNTLNDLPPWVRDLTADLLKRNITIEMWNRYVRILQCNSSDITTLQRFLSYLGKAIKTSVTKEIVLNDVIVTGKFYIGDTSSLDLITYFNEMQRKLRTISEGANRVDPSDINGNILIDNEETTVYEEHPIENEEIDDICK